MYSDQKVREHERRIERLNENLRLNTREIEKAKRKLEEVEREMAQLSSERARITNEIAQEERFKDDRIQKIQKESEIKK